MGRIAGHFEWDDERLTPGQRVGGGLAQNLFDDDGNLRGHARFIPDDTAGVGDFSVDSGQPVTSTQGDRADWKVELVVALVRELAPIVLEKFLTDGMPVVVRVWKQNILPFLDTRYRALRARIPHLRKKPMYPDIEILPAIDDDDDSPIESKNVSLADDGDTRRLMAIAAAFAFIEEQWEGLSRPDQVTRQMIDSMKAEVSGLSKEDLRVLCESVPSRVTPIQAQQLSLVSAPQWAVEQ